MVVKQKVLATGKGTQLEICMDFENTKHYFELKIEPLKDENQQVIGLACVSYDITDSK